MLVRALDNSESESCKEGRKHLYVSEVKADFYKFPIERRWEAKPEFESDSERREYLRHFAKQFFPKSEILNYRAVVLAVSRAVTRLERRGLVVTYVPRYGRGNMALDITDKGREQARILASLIVPGPQVQPIAERVNHHATC